MSEALPAIKPTALNAFYWDGAREERLMIQRCGQCGRYQHPPGPVCPACGSRDLSPAQVSGRGVVDTYTIVRRAFHPGFADQLPYVVARLALDEQPDLIVVANIRGWTEETLHIGAPVSVIFEHRSEGSLPQFVLADSAGAGA